MAIRMTSMGHVRPLLLLLLLLLGTRGGGGDAAKAWCAIRLPYVFLQEG